MKILHTSIVRIRQESSALLKIRSKTAEDVIVDRFGRTLPGGASRNWQSADGPRKGRHHHSRSRSRRRGESSSMVTPLPLLCTNTRIPSCNSWVKINQCDRGATMMVAVLARFRLLREVSRQRMMRGWCWPMESQKQRCDLVGYLKSEIFYCNFLVSID